MKLLCTADLHYRLPQFDWLVEQAARRRRRRDPWRPPPGDRSCPTRGADRRDLQYLQRLSERASCSRRRATTISTARGRRASRRRQWLRDLASDRIVVDGHSIDLDGVRFTVCPWWDGPLDTPSGRRAARVRCDRAPRSMGLGVPLAPGRLAAVRRWTGEAVSRPRPGRLDRSVSAGPRDLRAHSPSTMGRRGRLDRSARIHVDHQRRTPAGPDAAHVVIDLDERTAEWVALPDRELVRRCPALTSRVSSRGREVEPSPRSPCGSDGASAC